MFLPSFIQGVAGDELNLTCAIVLVDYLTPSAMLSISWSGGNTLSNDETELHSVNTTTSIGILKFSILKTSSGGRYTCHANLRIESLRLTRNGSNHGDVLVQRKAF